MHDWLLEIVLVACLVFIMFYLRDSGKKSRQENAVLDVIDRTKDHRLVSGNLRSELRHLLSQDKGASDDPFEAIVRSARVVDILGSVQMEECFRLIAGYMAEELPIDQQAVYDLLEAREREHSTVLTPFVAIPHILMDGEQIFRLFLVRCLHGIRFSNAYPDIKAMFVVIGTLDERPLHLKTLAAIARMIQHHDFEHRWLRATQEQQLRDLLLVDYSAPLIR